MLPCPARMPFYPRGTDSFNPRLTSANKNGCQVNEKRRRKRKTEMAWGTILLGVLCAIPRLGPRTLFFGPFGFPTWHPRDWLFSCLKLLKPTWLFTILFPQKKNFWEREGKKYINMHQKWRHVIRLTLCKENISAHRLHLRKGSLLERLKCPEFVLQPSLHGVEHKIFA